MRIDPYSLELFLAAVREGSIARAARSEHIAPSALSRRLADLEQAMGLPLLVRSPGGVTLTEAGQHALVRATRLHQDLQAMVREVRSLSGEVSGVVRLFANASAIVGFLPEKLKRFQADYPLVEIALNEHISADILRACLEDRADLGICAQPSQAQTPRGLDAWHFADDPLMVVLPRKHELGRERSLTLAQVARFPQVALQVGGALDRLLHDQAEAAQLPLRISVTVNSFDAQCRMVEAGLGICVVPTSAAAAYAGTRNFVRRPLAESWAQRRLQLFALRKSPRLKAVQALIDALAAPD
ncbi:LysR substrate-binding domain-containing protein [Herbaspirillum lusitanum]|uniref:LysR substrate-binding domain-containing protein n=1 Tax=Herbaspirillum lusitanum TaxID=213312 RepID=A0ABW9AC19_9BURK